MNSRYKGYSTDGIMSVLSLALLCVGGFIYVLYRPRNILLFDFLDECDLMPVVDTLRQGFSNVRLPSFFVYSLPAGLWTASYLLMMYCNTRGYSSRLKLMACLPLPMSAVVLEFMQFFGWCPGTFDVNDLICYIIPILIFINEFTLKSRRADP